MPGKHRRTETLTERLTDYGRAVVGLARTIGDTLILNPTPRTIGITAHFPRETSETDDGDRP